MPTAYFFLEQFRQELFAELKIQKEQIQFEAEGFVALNRPPQTSVWAQQIFSDSKVLEFQSIGEAAKALQAVAKGPWVDSSVSHHRRATLIAEKLYARSTKKLKFLDPRAREKKNGYCLVGQNKLIYSNKISPSYPRGEMQFQETLAAPSRAYLKLWELFTVYGVHPKANDVCLDMGSSPGGWTWVLTQLGCKVLSIDKAMLEDELKKNRNVISIKRDAFTLDPLKLTSEFGQIDWFFSDIICEPVRLLELVEKWRHQVGIKNFVCTIKFKGKTDTKTLEKLLQIPNSRAHHLFHNKHEVTWLALQNDI